MARKSSTIHIEESFWNEISGYMKENKIDSRNAAIEQMLLERRILLKVLDHKQAVVETSPKQQNLTLKEGFYEPKTEIGSMIDDVFDSMN